MSHDEEIFVLDGKEYVSDGTPVSAGNKRVVSLVPKEFTPEEQYTRFKDNYPEFVKSLEADYAKIMKRLIESGQGDDSSLRVFWAAVLVAKEANELLDLAHQDVFYNTPGKREDWIEEMGDVFFGLTMMMDIFNTDLTEIQKRNIEKLATRYPSGRFSSNRADKKKRYV